MECKVRVPNEPNRLLSLHSSAAWRSLLARRALTAHARLASLLCRPAANIAPAVQPLAFTTSLEVAFSMPPCLLVTPAYLSANCTRALDLYSLSPNSILKCDDGGWAHYASAYSACGGALSAIKMRSASYSGLALSFNALLYLILYESTQGMDHLTLAQFVRGTTGQRTLLVGTLLVLALGCLPLFLVFMLLSAGTAFQGQLHQVVPIEGLKPWTSHALGSSLATSRALCSDLSRV